MKKLLSILISLLLIVSIFAGCKNSEKSDSAAETTVNVEKVEIETGVVKGGIYRNKSLGLKIYCPIDYNSQTGGALELTPETIDSIPVYDYYIIDTTKDAKKAQTVSVMIEPEDSAKVKVPADTNTAYTLGNREYVSFEKKSKNKKVTTTYFVTSGSGKTVTIEFHRFTFDEAMEFIEEYFKTT